MSQTVNKIKQGLRSFTTKEAELRSAKVVSVNEDELTAVVALTGFKDTPLEDVVLGTVSENANGLVLIPSIDSHVIVGTIDGGGEYFIAKASNVDKVIVKIGDATYQVDTNTHVFNGGNNGGVPIVGKTANKISAAESKINEIIEKWNDFCNNYQPGSPSTTGMPAVLTSSILQKIDPITQTEDIENPKVKH